MVTKISSTVIGANALGTAGIGSNVIIARHLANNAVQSRHLGAGANASQVSENVVALQANLSANIDVVQDNVAAILDATTDLNIGSGKYFFDKSADSFSIANTNPAASSLTLGTPANVIINYGTQNNGGNVIIGHGDIGTNTPHRLDVRGTANTGALTATSFIVPNDGDIGSTGATDAIQIAADGVVTFKDDILIKNDGTIGSAGTAAAMTIDSNGIVAFADDIKIKDAGTIGSATTAGAVSIAADGTVNLATAGATVNSAVIKTAGLETIWVPASAMYPCTTNGCAELTQVETTAQQPELKVLDFDKDSDEFAQFTVAFPKSWNAGTVTFRAYWVGLAATTGVAWTLAGRSVADNAEAVGAFGTAVVVQDDSQGDATEVLISATSGAVTIAGAADDTLTFFQISRDVSDGNDDMAGDARLAGIQIFFTTSAATDA